MFFEKLNLVLIHDSIISISKIETHDFTNIKSVSGHRVLLKEVVEGREFKNFGPKVFNGMVMKKLAERKAPTTTMINKTNRFYIYFNLFTSFFAAHS
jgi:hypothetical protein